MEHISDADCKHAQRVWKYFEINNLGEHYNLHVQSNTLLLEEVFETWNKSIEKFKLDPVCFLSATELSWQTAFKKVK